jgi:hypothetical protein
MFLFIHLIYLINFYCYLKLIFDFLIYKISGLIPIKSYFTHFKHFLNQPNPDTIHTKYNTGHKLLFFFLKNYNLFSFPNNLSHSSEETIKQKSKESAFFNELNLIWVSNEFLLKSFN